MADKASVRDKHVLSVMICVGPQSTVAQTVKNLPAVQETGVCSLGWKHPLEKDMATHCSSLAWRIPWTEETGRLQSSPLGCKESDVTERLTLSVSTQSTQFQMANFGQVLSIILKCKYPFL